jgi:uncharacterized phage protein gp47/JayE
MSLTTPTTAEINAIIIAQLEAAFNASIPLLPKSFLRVLAKALAAVFIILYKYGGFMFLQMFVQTASIKDTEINGKLISPLKMWGGLLGLGEPVAAIQAELTIIITVFTQGGTLSSGSQLISSDTGVTYITIGAVTLDESTVPATVRAVSDQSGGGGAGVIGNLDSGSILSFANALGNVSRETTVTAQTVTGSDGETTEQYRQRVIDRFQKPSQGGAYANYETWGEEVVGIINVYPYTAFYPGQIDVYVEATPESSGSVDGIPTTAQLEAVLLSIQTSNEAEINDRQPINALVNAFPISRLVFSVIVYGLVSESLAEVKVQIEAALTDYFLDREPYIAGLSIPPRKDRITNSSVSATVEDVTTAFNSTFSGVVITVFSVPIAAYSLIEGEKTKLGSISYV